MANNEEEYEKGTPWFISFLIGALIGAGAAFLLAPKAGRQTREQLKGVAKDAKDKAEDYYGQVKEKITTAIHRGKEGAQESGE